MLGDGNNFPDVFVRDLESRDDRSGQCGHGGGTPLNPEIWRTAGITIEIRPVGTKNVASSGIRIDLGRLETLT